MVSKRRRRCCRPALAHEKTISECFCVLWLRLPLPMMLVNKCKHLMRFRARRLGKRACGGDAEAAIDIENRIIYKTQYEINT